MNAPNQLSFLPPLPNSLITLLCQVNQLSILPTLPNGLTSLQCYFNHDKYRILGEAPGESSHRVFTVELTRGRLTRTPHFYTIQGPNNRWFVDNMEIAAVKEFCRESGTMNSRD